jgi:hypothetical protein
MSFGSDDFGGVYTDTAWAAAEFEHIVTESQIGDSEHGSADDRSAIFDEVGVLVPRSSRRGPDRMKRIDAHCGRVGFVDRVVISRV